MKKLFALLLALCMGTFVLAGCGEESGESTSSGTSAGESSASEAAESEAPSAEETGDVLSGTLGDYDVTIIGAQLCEDYEGNPAIMITYNWTNNSDDNRMPGTSVTAEAFQNGVEMDTAYVNFSYNHISTEVQPGYSTDVDLLYKLDGDSPVEFEMVAVSDMLKSDATKLTATFDPAELSHYEG